MIGMLLFHRDGVYCRLPGEDGHVVSEAASLRCNNLAQVIAETTCHLPWKIQLSLLLSYMLSKDFHKFLQ